MQTSQSQSGDFPSDSNLKGKPESNDKIPLSVAPNIAHESLVEEIFAACRERGLRITKPLKVILTVLKEAPLPMSLAELELQIDSCDRTTIYRTLQRLEQVGVLRQLNFIKQGAKFTLKADSEHKDYLICEGCGKVEALEVDCPVKSLEKKLMEKTGFRGLSHELEFYGLCPKCEYPEPK